MRKPRFLAWRIGFAYTGTVVGAGFASGQEILQFFTIYGKYGFWGILLAMFLFSWLGIRLMLVGARLGASSFQECSYHLFGTALGRWINRLITVILFGFTVAMISGTGALFAEHWGISFHLGVWITLTLAFFVLIRGLTGILEINSFFVPLMLGFLLLVGIQAWSQGEWEVVYQQLRIEQGGHWLISAITYVAFNLAMAQAVLVPLGGEIQDERALRIGGWIGGLILGFMLFACNYALQLNLDDVHQLEIPMGFLVSFLGKGIQYAFLFILWAEIFTTLLSNIYGLTSSIQQKLRLRPWMILVLIFIVGYLFSLVGFSTLVRYLYPIFGYCGVWMLFQLMWKGLPERRRLG